MKRARAIEEHDEDEFQGAPNKRAKYDDGDSQSEMDSADEKGVKWTTLEHRGVAFFPGYVPHGVKLLFKVSIS
jgi:hypothetical protein